MFGYWPFHQHIAYLWASYDNNINVITSMHIFYAVYAKVRSIKNPKCYDREFMLKRPYILMALIWVYGLGLWSIIVWNFGLHIYSFDVEFHPKWIKAIINIFSWLIWLIAILVITIYLYVLLLEKKKFSNKVNQKKPLSNQCDKPESSITKILKKIKKFRLGADKKILIIIGMF